MTYQSKVLRSEDPVPKILIELAKEFRRSNAYEQEGIFRVPGNQAVVSKVREELIKGNYNVDWGNNPHNVSTVFKLYLRELYEPIIPTSQYPVCLRLGMNRDVNGALDFVKNQLDKVSAATLIFVIKLLQTFIRPEVVAKTKMDSKNLAIVFAPNILRCPSEDPLVIMASQEPAMNFVHILLENVK